MEDILTWQTLFVTLAIFIFSLFVRRIAETMFPTLSNLTPLSTAQRVWEGIVLPSLPVIVGVLFTLLVKNWPYPKALQGLGPRVVYGMVCGFFSTWAYRILKAILTQRFTVDLDQPIITTPGVAGDKCVPRTSLPPAGS